MIQATDSRTNAMKSRPKRLKRYATFIKVAALFFKLMSSIDIQSIYDVFARTHLHYA